MGASLTDSLTRLEGFMGGENIPVVHLLIAIVFGGEVRITAIEIEIVKQNKQTNGQTYAVLFGLVPGYMSVPNR